MFGNDPLDQLLDMSLLPAAGSGSGNTNNATSTTPQSAHGGNAGSPARRSVGGVAALSTHRRVTSLESVTPPTATGHALMPPFHRRIVSMENSPVTVPGQPQYPHHFPQNRRISGVSDYSAASSPFVSSPLVGSPMSHRSPAMSEHSAESGGNTPTSLAAGPSRSCAKCGVTETPKWRKDKSNPHVLQ